MRRKWTSLRKWQRAWISKWSSMSRWRLMGLRQTTRTTKPRLAMKTSWSQRQSWNLLTNLRAMTRNRLTRRSRKKGLRNRKRRKHWNCRHRAKEELVLIANALWKNTILAIIHSTAGKIRDVKRPIAKSASEHSSSPFLADYTRKRNMGCTKKAPKEVAQVFHLHLFIQSLNKKKTYNNMLRQTTQRKVSWLCIESNIDDKCCLQNRRKAINKILGLNLRYKTFPFNFFRSFSMFYNSRCLFVTERPLSFWTFHSLRFLIWIKFSSLFKKFSFHLFWWFAVAVLVVSGHKRFDCIKAREVGHNTLWKNAERQKMGGWQTGSLNNVRLSSKGLESNIAWHALQTIAFARIISFSLSKNICFSLLCSSIQGK